MDKKKENFIKALRAGYGIIATACEAVGVSRTTYYRWLNGDEEFKQQVEDVVETQIDYVESRLIKKITEGDTTSIIFYLKTKGKKRGYSEKAQQPQPERVVANALPDKQEAKDRKDMEAKIKNKKTYLVKLLKNSGKYTAELTCQVDVTAQLLVRADILKQEIMAEGYSPVNVEYSREGNERFTINPKERLYVETLERVERSLKALGMNLNSKEHPTEKDGFNEFMDEMRKGID